MTTRHFVKHRVLVHTPPLGRVILSAMVSPYDCQVKGQVLVDGGAIMTRNERLLVSQ